MSLLVYKEQHIHKKQSHQHQQDYSELQLHSYTHTHYSAPPLHPRVSNSAKIK